MMLHPQRAVQESGFFNLSTSVPITAHACLCREVTAEFWQGFSHGSSVPALSETGELICAAGGVAPLPPEGYAYSLHVTRDGFCLSAATERDLIHGFMALLDRMEAVDEDGALQVRIGCCRLWDAPKTPCRMVHFCIFPETELWELQRFVRLCGALRYTHIVLEFWGMLQFDCLQELAWPCGFTKAQVAPIIREARELGLEVVPMFNHWGHASAGRVMYGKHVVLDQNPALQTHFSEDGWCWNIQNPRTRALLREVRRELIELCGAGEYFHIGCDEAYNFDLTDPAALSLICDYINEIATELRSLGRRCIIWGDMLLFRHPHYDPQNKYTCNAPTPHCERAMLDAISKDVIIADWQYSAPCAPVETAAVFTQAGFDCLLCPWDRGKAQLNAVLATVQEQELFGLLHTTWHTLAKGMPYVTAAGIDSYEGRITEGLRAHRTQTAALLRKICPARGVYERAGWVKRQIGNGSD